MPVTKASSVTPSPQQTPPVATQAPRQSQARRVEGKHDVAVHLHMRAAEQSPLTASRGRAATPAASTAAAIDAAVPEATRPVNIFQVKTPLRFGAFKTFEDARRAMRSSKVEPTHQGYAHFQGQMEALNDTHPQWYARIHFELYPELYQPAPQALALQVEHTPPPATEIPATEIPAHEIQVGQPRASLGCRICLVSSSVAAWVITGLATWQAVDGPAANRSAATLIAATIGLLGVGTSTCSYMSRG